MERKERGERSKKREKEGRREGRRERGEEEERREGEREERREGGEGWKEEGRKGGEGMMEGGVTMERRVGHSRMCPYIPLCLEGCRDILKNQQQLDVNLGVKRTQPLTPIRLHPVIVFRLLTSH